MIAASTGQNGNSKSVPTPGRLQRMRQSGKTIGGTSHLIHSRKSAVCGETAGAGLVGKGAIGRRLTSSDHARFGSDFPYPQESAARAAFAKTAGHPARVCSHTRGGAFGMEARARLPAGRLIQPETSRLAGRARVRSTFGGNPSLLAFNRSVSRDRRMRRAMA